MNKKKILVLLATLVISTALAACGNSDGGYTTGDNSKDGRSQVSQGELQSIPDFSAEDIEGNKIDNSIFKENKVTLVNVWATWCGPCKMLGPVLEEVSEELAGKADFFAVDVDENQGLAIKNKIQSIPAIVVFKDGEPVDRQIGFVPKPQLVEFINKSIG